MGAKSSQPKDTPHQGTSRNAQYDSSKSFVRAPYWSVVEEVPIADWKNGVGEEFGFDLYDNWFVHQLKVEKRPWSSNFTVSGHMPGSKQEKKICSFKCEVLETGRIEKVNWHIKTASVLAVCDAFMVIQVVVTKAVKILIVQGDFLLGSYTFSCINEPFLQECYISPDCSFILLRQNISLRMQLGHHRDYNHNLYVLRLKHGLVQRLYFIPIKIYLNNPRRCEWGSSVSFDPRVSYGQVTVLTTADSQERGIFVYDLRRCCQIRSAYGFTRRYITASRYSPDGSMIVILCDVNQPLRDYSDDPGNIFILCSDSFQVMHRIVFSTVRLPRQVCYLHMFPTFSRNGHFLATIENYHSPSHVILHQMPSSSFNLKEFCRKAILHHTPRRCLHELPLPDRLLQYLRFIETTTPQEDLVDDDDSTCPSLHWEVNPDF